MFSFLFSVKAYAAIVPAESGIGSYTDTMPAGNTATTTSTYITTNISSPIPTNDWWSSAISTPTSFRMFAYPNVYKCDYNGLLMGLPEVKDTTNTSYYGTDADAPFRQQLLIGTQEDFNSDSVKVDGYSDWTVKLKWEKPVDATKYFTATLVQGNPFAYFEFSQNISTASIRFPLSWDNGTGYDLYDSSGTSLVLESTTTVDMVTLRFNHSGKTKYFGIYAPQGASFYLTGESWGKAHVLEIIFSTTSEHFVSILPISGTGDLNTFYNYAYAFVNGSSVTWAVDEAHGNVSTTFNVYAQSKRNSQNKTLMALFPHQWKYLSSGNVYLAQSYQTLRGTMKVMEGNSFQTTYDFNGILPFLPDKGTYDKEVLKSLINTDQDTSLANTGIYFHGKELWKLASLLNVADQLGDNITRDYIKNRLRSDLADWYTFSPGELNKCFYYNQQWGSMIGCQTEFGAQNMTDHHFQYGYFIYASALLAMYDNIFVNNYGAMVENLIRDIAAPTRNDPKYPFLRYFLPYQGFGYADGLAIYAPGGYGDGNDQESSSEAMNAWAAIYWWGALSNNETYKNLGLWLYASEYAAIKEYYFDIDKQTYGNGYAHNCVGMLFGGKADFNTWFGSSTEYIHGIQFIPITPSSLYLGYNTAYARENYDYMVSEKGGNETTWQDVIWQFQSFYDPSIAINKYNSNPSLTSSNLINCTKTYLYYWIHSLNGLGNVDTTLYADMPSFGVFNKSGVKTYVFYNPYAVSKTVNIYRRSDNSFAGRIVVGPRSLFATNSIAYNPQPNLNNVKVYPSPYKPGSGGVFDNGILGEGIVFDYLTTSANIKIFSLAGELVAELIETDGNGICVWNARNQSGNKVASGIYVYLITNPENGSQKAKGKLAIEK
ncbi:MAG: glycosyl hydrolase [Elusimicrobia bacterium]|nr:glycosyl hydrolase [Elusimicrobiota bacterium]